MDTMTTVSEVLARLKQEGYTVDFNLRDNCLACHGNALELYPGEFVVDKHFRFEGPSDPSDAAIVYAISSARHNVKGTLVNGYGPSAEPATNELVRALHAPSPAPAPPTAENVVAEKGNAATAQRPAGERTLDAALVQFDLPAATHQLKQETTWHTSDRNALTLFKTNGLRIVLVALREGAVMKTHTAAGHISLQVLEGRLRFHAEPAEPAAVELAAGQMLALHAGIPHSVAALTETTFLLTLTTTLANAKPAA